VTHGSNKGIQIVMKRAPYSHLSQLVGDGKWADAEVFCQEMVESGADHVFWTTQLGYVCFLNDEDDGARYERAPAIFESLVTEDSANVNARFWQAYVDLILFDDQDTARLRLDEIRKLDSNHAYTSLVLAGLHDGEEASECIQATLRVQPDNFRALLQAFEYWTGLGNRKEATEAAVRIVDHDPYVETAYGIINPYMNEVLTGAEWAHQTKQKMLDWLKNASAL
jgi:tetratricopeptide (TPR) repeat protein